jgi:hypothetical protein
MRQKIYWNTTNYGEPEPSYINTIHIDHCIDQMRQSLMCTVDVTPIPYEWYPKYGAYMPTTGIMHTCRNFEAVQEYGIRRSTVMIRWASKCMCTRTGGARKMGGVSGLPNRISPWSNHILMVAAVIMVSFWIRMQKHRPVHF